MGWAPPDCDLLQFTPAVSASACPSTPNHKHNNTTTSRVNTGLDDVLISFWRFISNCQDGSLGTRQPGRDISGHCWASARLSCRHGAPRPPRSLVAPRRRRAAWARSASSIRRRTKGASRAKGQESPRRAGGHRDGARTVWELWARCRCGGGPFCSSFCLTMVLAISFEAVGGSARSHPTRDAQGPSPS